MHHLQLRHFVALIVLCCNTWTDLRKKEIQLPITLTAGLFGFLLAVKTKDVNLIYLAGFAVGGLLACFSMLTCGSVGRGDAILLISTAALLPWDSVLTSFTAALVLSALYSLFLLVIRHKDRKTGIAFVPFLLAGYLLCYAPFLFKAVLSEDQLILFSHKLLHF